MIKLIMFLLTVLGYSGIYIPDWDMIICDSPSACVHEEGHQLDFILNRPSQTIEFQTAVNAFPLLSEKAGTCIIGGNSCHYSEAYALLYESVFGDLNNMPENFREFYQ